MATPLPGPTPPITLSPTNLLSKSTTWRTHKSESNAISPRFTKKAPSKANYSKKDLKNPQSTSISTPKSTSQQIHPNQQTFHKALLQEPSREPILTNKHKIF